LVSKSTFIIINSAIWRGKDEDYFPNSFLKLKIGDQQSNFSLPSFLFRLYHFLVSYLFSTKEKQ